MKYNALFEYVIRTSGENTDDIDDFDDRDNFWAPIPKNLLFEQVLREMANYTKDMFIGAFENALIAITSNRNYQNDDDPDKTVREVISLIISSNPEIYPFAIKYDDEDGGKIIVFERYKTTVENATKQRMKNAKQNYESALTEVDKEKARNNFYTAKKTLSKITVATEIEIRNWIKNTMSSIKVQDYKDTAIDVFMVMYYALPTIFTPQQVSTKLNNLQVLPHLDGSVISSH